MKLFMHCQGLSNLGSRQGVHVRARDEKRSFLPRCWIFRPRQATDAKVFMLEEQLSVPILSYTS